MVNPYFHARLARMLSPDFFVFSARLGNKNFRRKKKIEGRKEELRRGEAAKAEMEVREIGIEPVTIGRADEVLIIEPRTAAQHPNLTICRSGRIFFRGITVIIPVIPVCYPFPNVSCHIQSAVRAGPCRQAACFYRCSITARIICQTAAW